MLFDLAVALDLQGLHASAERVLQQACRQPDPPTEPRQLEAGAPRWPLR